MSFQLKTLERKQKSGTQIRGGVSKTWIVWELTLFKVVKHFSIDAASRILMLGVTGNL